MDALQFNKAVVETVANVTYGFTVTYRQVSDQMS